MPVECQHCGREFPNHHGLKVHIARAHRPAPETPPPEVVKKIAVRRKPARPRNPPGAAPPAVNYCPHCGENIALVGAAIAAARKIEGGS